MDIDEKFGKWIPGYEGFYSVDRLGNVWSFNAKRRRVPGPIKMVACRTVNGLLFVVLQVNGAKDRFRVHDLVMKTFSPCEDERKFVHHKDGNNSNNAICNLEWRLRARYCHDESVHGSLIPRYKGLYSVTKDGQVWSLLGLLPREILSSPNVVSGYPTVTLTGPEKGARTTHTVHSLIMEAYVGPRPEGMEVCHNNGDPADCRLANLRYDTPLENKADMVRHGRSNRGDRSPMAKIDSKMARMIKIHLLQMTGVRGEQRSLARRLGVSEQLICDIKMGRRWDHVAV